MKIYSTYSVKIKYLRKIFQDTVAVYRQAVDFLIQVCLEEWETLLQMDGDLIRQQKVERFCHATKGNPDVKYPLFDKRFYKFPSYLRRAAINEAIGKVSSYRSNLANWEQQEQASRGRMPGLPKAGYIYPCMYKDNMYLQTGEYTARIKVYIRNTWDWINISMRKSDVDYIKHHCADRKNAPLPFKNGEKNFSWTFHLKS